MASVLTAKVQNVLLHKGKSSTKNSKVDERRRSRQQSRVIPPEPVQEKPEGDPMLHEIQPALQKHNLARANKGSKKLEWDDRLMKEAEAYAQKLAQTGQLEHSGVEEEGENLFMSSQDANLETAVDSWLGEEKKYTGQIVAGAPFEEGANFGM